MADAIWNNNYLLSNLDAQKLYAQSPLTTGVSGTSAWIGLEPSARYNETVLWSGNGVNSFTTTEPLTNFERVKFYLKSDAAAEISCVELPMIGRNTSNVELAWSDNWQGSGAGWKFLTWYSYLNNTGMSAFNVNTTYYMGLNSNLGFGGGSYGTAAPLFHKVIGINRKEV